MLQDPARSWLVTNTQGRRQLQLPDTATNPNKAQPGRSWWYNTRQYRVHDATVADGCKGNPPKQWLGLTSLAPNTASCVVVHCMSTQASAWRHTYQAPQCLGEQATAVNKAGVQFTTRRHTQAEVCRQGIVSQPLQPAWRALDPHWTMVPQPHSAPMAWSVPTLANPSHSPHALPA